MVQLIRINSFVLNVRSSYILRAKNGNFDIRERTDQTPFSQLSHFQ